jgi:MoCo/4Fe-4S cofactor protein with predicted Tat translocation signal
MPPEVNHEPEYWQSLDQWLDTPEFRDMMKNEFPEDAPEWLDPVSRRQFVTAMGASIALAAAGCNPSLKPASQKKVVPYVNQPSEIVPGVPLFFASTVPQAGGIGLGVIVKSVEGRPIKVEGNPLHPSSLGGTDVFSPASILSMYEPNRSKKPTSRQTPTTFERALAALKDTLAGQAASKGAGVRIVSGVTTSPTFGAQMEEFLKRFPAAKWIQYEPINADNAKRAGFAAFGKYVNPIYNLSKAKVALSLDSDFLSATGPGAVRYSREFMANRKVRTIEAALKKGEGVKADDMNRLYAVEGMLTSTGAVADHRLPLKPSEVEAFTRALAKELGVSVPVSVADSGELPELAKQWIKPLAEDLAKNKGTAVVLVGEQQPPAVHLLALAINEKLGAFGSTLTFTDPVENRPAEVAESTARFKELCSDISSEKVDLLLLIECNPAYDAPVPPGLNFIELMAKVKGPTILFGNSRDETFQHSRWHINATHYLETWGDLRAHDGTVSLQQILMAPLHGGKSLIELFSLILDQGISDPYELVKATWKKYFDEKVKSGAYEDWWQRAVKDGIIVGTTFLPVAVTPVKLDALLDKNFATPLLPKGKIELQFRSDPTVYDGRYAENGWLQELPKPITKLTWDNALIVSPATAEKLGCGIDFRWTGGEHGNSEVDMVEITVGGKKINAAVWILHGHADECATLHLGYGRTHGADNGVGKGFNAYTLRNADGLYLTSIDEIKKTNVKYTLACTQGQHAMESRKPARHGTVQELKKDPVFAQIPAASPGEYKEIRELTPGTPEDLHRLHIEDNPYYPKKDKDHAKEEAHSPAHDHRIIPLNLYPDNPTQVAGEQSSKTYRRWSMAVDLGACTGCSACIIACVSENNIPIVGKTQVTKGRAMHWIRVDRYFSIPGEHNQEDKLGGKDVKSKQRSEMAKKSAQIRAHFQPVMCQHCEKAPCEVVCPVGATVHSADGLNDMAYNRCVGTRYCSNNCPYKVRRFNFLQYTDYTTDSLKLLNNPEVTVRTRGVMEKCTYCTQRIRNAEIEAEREHAKRPKDKNGRPKIMDGEIITACQSACPTGAITFGDLNDTSSVVLRTKAEPTNYGLLAELNTMPRTSYLAAIRNPNDKMPGMPKKGEA